MLRVNVPLKKKRSNDLETIIISTIYFLIAQQYFMNANKIEKGQGFPVLFFYFCTLFSQ
jgi:hypothetical protein